MEQSEELSYFLQITQVPRPSYSCEKMGSFLMAFAQEHNLDCCMDGAGNVIITRPGKGEPVVLQGHQDMVPSVIEGKDFDFENSPIETIIKDGWITANGTTLGADDGAGVALMMCALTSPELEGIALECIFTTDEEVGLIGASKLEQNCVKGKTLLNLDEEDISCLTMGCAGSTDVEIRFLFAFVEDSNDAYRLSVSGLLGGHSAGMIDAGRGNAILIAASFVHSIKGARLISFTGGSAPNVIPMSTVIEFTAPAGIDVKDLADHFAKAVKGALQDSDPGVSITLEKIDGKKDSWSSDNTDSFLSAVLSLPNGCLDKDEFGVKTSSNVGVVRTSDVLELIVKPRSSSQEDLVKLIDVIMDTLTGVGGLGDRPEAFPPWREDADSPLIKMAAEVYRNYFGKEPKIIVIHGGLECSIIKDKNPGMKAVAFGPTILGAHSPDEKMDLETFSQARGYLFALLHALRP